MARRLRAPSPALLIALLALFVSIGGVGYAASKIDTNDIKNKAVTKPKIDKQAVTTNRIADQAVKTKKLADQSVTTDKIADQAVTTDKIADQAVSTDKIADQAVSTPKIADAAVTNSKLANNSVASANIIDGQLRASDLGTINQVQTTSTVANNNNRSLTVSCPSGTRLITGGGGINLGSPPANVYVTASLRVGNAWRIIVRNQSGATRPVFVQAQCLEA
jgi:hypothetical protein